MTPAINPQFLWFGVFFTSKMMIPIHLPQIINLFNPTPHQFAGLWLRGGGAQWGDAAPRPVQCALQNCSTARGEVTQPALPIPPITLFALSSALDMNQGKLGSLQPVLFPFSSLFTSSPCQVLPFLLQSPQGKAVLTILSPYVKLMFLQLSWNLG